MAYPILAPNSTWYKSSNDRSTITEINIVDSYTHTGNENETWNADVDNSGSIKCYITGTVLTIAGNGSGKIAANADSEKAFGDSNNQGLFNNVTSINGLELFDTSNVTTMRGMFIGCIKVKIIDISTWDVHNVTTMNYMFGGHSAYGGNMALTSIGNTQNWNTSSLTNTRCMFQACSSLTSLDVSNWDVSKVTTMEHMFHNCSSLTTLDVSNWDVSKVTTMEHMFNNCSSLTTLDVSNWDVSSVTTMQSMFRQCSSLTSLAVSNWDVGNVTTMQSMFSADSYGATPFKLTTLDVSKWDTSSCTNMSFMFYGMKGNGYQGDITIDISKWDVSKVTNFDHMFANSSCTITNVDKWNTSSAINFNAMFHKIKNKSINVSSFDTSNVNFFCQMFEYCYYLEEIIGLENFDTSQGVGFDEMFGDCNKLKELNLSSFDTRKAKDGVTASANGHKTATLYDMFRGMYRLEKITFGENFSSNGDGTTAYTSHHAVLPTPSAEYIDGADGNWYVINGTDYAGNSIPTLTAQTYYASKNIVRDIDVLAKNGVFMDIANAIREKNGSTDAYTPDEMCNAIRYISGSGGSLVIEPLEVTEDGTYIAPSGVIGYSPVIVNAANNKTQALDEYIEGATDLYSNATYVQRESLFQNKSFLTSLNFPYLTNINGKYVFYGCRGLKTVSMPLLKNLPVQTFYNCTSLEELNFPSVESTASSSLANCTAATKAYLPNCKSLGDNAFANSNALEYIEIGSLSSVSYVYRNTFSNCTALTTLVLRFTSFKNLENVNAFTGTPIESGTGYIYVPSALVNTFKAATNWSTFANQFRVLEDYTVDGTATGEFDMTKI